MDTTPLRDAFGTLLDAAATVAKADPAPIPRQTNGMPTRLISKDTILVDQPIPLRDIITGLAHVELPGHAAQLRALLPERATA